MRAFAFSVLIALVGLAAGCGKKPKGSSESSGGDDKAAVQGDWAFAKLDTGDKDAAFLEEMMKDARITIKDNLVIASPPIGKGPGGKDEQPAYAIFSVDASKSPKEIDLTEADAKGSPKPSKKYEFDQKTGKGTTKDGPPETLRGIYKLEGDTIIVALGIGEKQVRPTEFKSVTPKGGKGGDKMDGVIILHLKKK